jgi:hypothetical protein
MMLAEPCRMEPDVVGIDCSAMMPATSWFAVRKSSS